VSEPVAIVGVSYLNANPLLAGFEAALPAPFSYAFRRAEPATCADQLAAGRVDASLVPVAALPGIPGAQLLPGLGIATRGPVTSVLIIAHKPLGELQTLAVHSASRTSAVLARLLLAERWGVYPLPLPRPGSVNEMLREADAALVIGDLALQVRGRTGLLEVDLAGEWREWTGLPFVFAVWATRPSAPAGFAEVAERSLAFAEQHWEELLPRWSAAHDVAAAEARTYLQERLYYRLGEDERAGMQEFLRRAERCGFLVSPGAPAG